MGGIRVDRYSCIVRYLHFLVVVIGVCVCVNNNDWLQACHIISFYLSTSTSIVTKNTPPPPNSEYRLSNTGYIQTTLHDRRGLQ